MSERTPREAPSAPAAAAPEEDRRVGSSYWLRRHANALEATMPYDMAGIAIEMRAAADRADALAARLEELEQTTAELCEDCGWRMRVPGRGCANCERYRLRARYEEAIEALRKIRDMPPARFEGRHWLTRRRVWEGVIVRDMQRIASEALRRHEESRTTGERSEP